MTTSKKILNTLVVLLVTIPLLVATTILAAPPGTRYAPGETLNPTCAPTDTNCGVDQIYVSPTTLQYGIGTSTPYSKLTLWGTGTTTGKTFEIANFASTTLFSLLDNGLAYFLGNVGIGTTAPTSILALGGTAARTIQMERNTTAATAGQGLTLSSGGAIAGTADLVGGDLTLKSGISTGLGTSALRFFTATAGVTGITDNSPTEKMTILGSGNVGIGTGNPSLAKLQVLGDIYTNSGLGFYAIGDGGARNVFYRGGTDFEILRNYNQQYTVQQIWSPPGALSQQREATLALVRGDEPNQEYIDVYNNGYTAETQFGVRIQKRGTGVYRDFVFDQYDGVTKTPLMIIKANTNVGIGTNAPSGILSVTPLRYNTGTASQSLTTITGVGTTFTSAMVGSQFVFANGVSAGTITVFGSITSLTVSVSQTVASQGFAISYTGLQVGNTGNVGIGTTSPGAKLEVNVGNVDGIKIKSSNSGFVRLYSDGTGANWGLANDYNAASTFEILSGALTADPTTRRFAINGANGDVLIPGNVGIGTSAPTSNLQVAQGTTGTGTVSNLAGGTTVTGVGTQFTNTFKIGDTITIPATTGQTVAISAIASDTSMTTAAITLVNTSVAYTLVGGTRFSVFGNGNVGIGTTTPWRTLSVVGTMAINGLTTSTAGNALCIVSGFEVVTAGNTSCVTSSLKTKTDIQSITSDEAQHDILSLVPSVYTNIEKGDRRFGFIAEQANTVDSKIVEYASEDRTLPSGLVINKGDPSGFDYLRYPAVLTKFVQDMYASMQTLVGKVGDVAKQVGSLISRVVSLEIFNQNQVVNGLTTKDRVTGEEYCVYISGGVMQTTKGACVQTANVVVGATASGVATSTSPITISIQGNNPATINVGDTYGDLGATITAPASAMNLGIKVAVDGGALTDIGNLSIDTKTAGVHHIVYTVVDQNNATTTAERILNVVSLNLVPLVIATSTIADISTSTVVITTTGIATVH